MCWTVFYLSTVLEYIRSKIGPKLSQFKEEGGGGTAGYRLWLSAGMD